MKRFSALLLCSVFLFPVIARAQIGDLPFGGLVVAAVPCSCTVGIAIFFAPMYPNPPFPYAGSLHFIPGISFLHPFYKIGVPTTWHLGKYVPGVGSCWSGIPPACVPVPTVGIITRVGTSEPGFGL